MQDMERISGGRFLIGSDQHYAEEAPVHPVEVDPFWIDRRPVTKRTASARSTAASPCADRPR
jgi:formylglycine-generating enzyme required for sulfatase activity